MTKAPYEVTVACLVHVPVVTAQGNSFATLYQGDVVPDSVPKDKLDFWLDGGMIRKVGEAKAEANEENQDEDPAGNGGQDQTPKFTARTPKGDLVAHAVKVGDYPTTEEAEKATLKDLQARYVRTGE